MAAAWEEKRLPYYSNEAKGDDYTGTTNIMMMSLSSNKLLSNSSVDFNKMHNFSNNLKQGPILPSTKKYDDEFVLKVPQRKSLD